MSTTQSGSGGTTAEEQDNDLTDALRTVVNAGASGAFAAVLMTDAPDANDGRHHVRSKVFHRTGRGGLPGPWGDFMTALWDGRTTEAWRRADYDNRRLLEAAGVAPLQ